MDICIRAYVNGDIPAMLHIEQESFDTPWDSNDFILRLEKNTTACVVAVNKRGKVLGYALCKVTSKHSLLLNIAVERKYRRRGIGSELIGVLQDSFTKLGFRIDERNLAAQLFFAKVGFHATRVIRGCFGPDDAYVMVWKKAKVMGDQLYEHVEP